MITADTNLPYDRPKLASQDLGVKHEAGHHAQETCVV